MIYYVPFLELISILILFQLSINQMVFSDFPVYNISTVIYENKLHQFNGNGFSDFNHFLYNPISDIIYVVSNGNELLQIERSNLKYINKFSLKKSCNQDLCEKGKIDTVQLNTEKNLLWFCFASKSILDASPYSVCYIADQNTMNSEHLGQWFADTYISTNFEQQSVQLVTSEYTYSGLFLENSKALIIYKNPLTFGKGTTHKILLPRFFLKPPGKFIFSFQDNYSIYFLYLETDFVCGFRNEIFVTRLLRLCDHDFGNSKNEFSVFGKVDVECKKSNPNKAIPPFTYRIATNGHWLPRTRQLVVSFANSEEVTSSAICIYSIQSIESAFNSDLKKSSEKPTYDKNKYQNICQELRLNNMVPNSLDNFNILFKTFPLRKDIVKNESIYLEKDTKFVEIASEESYWSKNRRIVLFISSQSRDRTSLTQIVLQPYFCVWSKYLFSENITMLNVLNRNNKTELYIGTSRRVIQFPMDVCNKHLSENSCFTAKNPYCFWNSLSKKCSYISTETDFLFILNSRPFCPQVPNEILEMKSKLWIPCSLVSLSEKRKRIGTCNCKALGDKSVGRTITVLPDCSINGNWTTFSSWSDCSVTCGVGSQMRIRSCENPRPQNGGLDCKGRNQETRTCNTNVICENFKGEISKKPPTVWSEWSPCSTTCGHSYQTRRSKCLVEKCSELPIETRICLKSPCEYIILSDWTQWSSSNITSRTKVRLRFQCRSRYHHERGNMSFNYIVRSNTNIFCSPDECPVKYKNQIVTGKYEEWSEWSLCTSRCDVSQWKTRTRNCLSINCLGPIIDYEPCEKKPCISAWTCWSSWRGCSTNCETRGTRTKTRHCAYDHHNSSCNNRDIEKSECPIIPCHNAYSQWSAWSSCKRGGVITRTRKCIVKRECLFPLLQSRPCAYQVKGQPEEFSYIYMIVSGLIGFVLGILIAAILCYVWWKCTINVLNSTYSESMKISNVEIPVDFPSIYDSQSLQILPEAYNSLCRRRSPSYTESYFKPSSPQYVNEPGSLSPSFFSNYQIRHPPLLEEPSLPMDIAS